MSESDPGLLGEGGRVTDPAADTNNIKTINNLQTEDIMNLFDDYQINPLDVLDVQVSIKEEEEDGGGVESSNVNLEEKLSNIKDLCLRSDLSAVVKIDKILMIVDPSSHSQPVLPPVLVPKNYQGEIPTSFPELPSLDEPGVSGGGKY